MEYDELDFITAKDRKPEIAPFCTSCGYNLTGLPSKRCPECGTVFNKAEWQRMLAEAKKVANDIREANAWARGGLVIASIGVVCVALAAMGRNAWWTGIFILPGGILGMCGAALGLHVFRARRRLKCGNEIMPPPAYGLAMGCVALGITAMAGALFAW